ncbi:MAG: type II toxin-antitoxin system Phd/YefM family antitoxin [Armatimonadetes bacterium]|nr:type II toxin-antitoxin system Phd/YefM family antitoxin [Armatimonadota bacterium]
MVSISATKARSEFFELLKKSIRGHELIRISTREGDAVLISEEDYDSLLETLELMSTPGLAQSIAAARKEIERGETYSLNEVLGSK